MGALHINGFEIPVARGGYSEDPGVLGGADYGVTGNLLGGYLAITESSNVSTPPIELERARAIKRLCSPKGHDVWRAEDADGSSQYSTTGLKTTGAAPGLNQAQAKFGTWSFSTTGGSTHSVATVGAKYTIAAWVKPDGGAWQHEILRSDGAQWVDMTRDDNATLNIDVDSSTFRLLFPASGTDYFDELVHLPFEIWTPWGAEWPSDEKFPKKLSLTGDLLSGERIDGCAAGARLTSEGYYLSFDGLGAVVQLDIRGPERTEDT